MHSFTYRHTNCFVVESTTERKLLAIDAGWPCSLREYQRALKHAGWKFEDISWAVVTHFHLDHAGLLGEFQSLGIVCLAIGDQVATIDKMETTILKNVEYGAYRKIEKAKLVEMDATELATELSEFGIEIKVLPTRGHSPDSVSFLTSKGEAIIGDLYPPNQFMEDDAESAQSWEILKTSGARTIYPSHAPAFEIE